MSEPEFYIRACLCTQELLLPSPTPSRTQGGTFNQMKKQKMGGAAAHFLLFHLVELRILRLSRRKS
jgi:hypothetical protein